MFNKYGMTYDWFMMLEVRNDDWTVETIREYLCFLDYVFETYKRDVYLNDIQFMAADVMRLLPNHRSPFHAGSYNSISLASSGDNLSCSLSRNMIVRLGDLALCPCHRLSYPHLLYGNLKTENGEITGITSNNIQFAEHCLAMNSRTSNLGCDVCKLKNICLQGCYGSQYEARKDPFITIPSVCSLFYEKTRFLLKKYEESGILNYLFNGTFGEYDRFTNKQAINRLRTIYFDLIKELTNGQ